MPPNAASNPPSRVVRGLVVSIAAAAIVFAASLALPLRAQGRDTLAGRLSAITLACSGDHDLAHIGWVQDDAARGLLPYWLAMTPDKQHLVSTFGPTPAWLGSLAMIPLPDGAGVTDRELMRRARWASALAISISALLLHLALLRRLTSGPALLWTLGTAFSFAGVGTLGQGLWQQTTALPWLMGVICTLFWSDKRWPLLLTPALAVALAMTRPPEAILALALLAAWIVRAHAQKLSLGVIASALVLGLVASAPWVVWNLTYFDSALPLGQWQANDQMSNRVFDFSLGHVARGILGLLASPARGALWFAPTLAVAIVLGIGRVVRARRLASLEDILLVGVLGQLVLAGCFFKWWGGVAFGPRLLSLSIWCATALLAASSPSGEAGSPGEVGRGELSRSRWAIYGALALTCMVGLLGAVRYDPRQWELRVDPDKHPEALWNVVDSPLPALLRHTGSPKSLTDAPSGPFVYCKDGAVLARVK